MKKYRNSTDWNTSYLNDYFRTSNKSVDGSLLSQKAIIADISASLKTTGFMQIGSTFNSDINKKGDVDWIKVNLTAGTKYVFEQNGLDSRSGTLADPLIKGLYDSKGKYISLTGNDDASAATLNSSFTYTPSKSGAYFLAAASYGSSVGTYQVKAYNFVDITNPELTSANPSDNSTAVNVTSNIILTFSEDIKFGTGNVTLSSSVSNLVINTNDSSQISINKNVLTINPASNLEYDTHYTIHLDSGAIVDLAGNSFSGFTSEFITSPAPSGGQETWTIMVYLAADNDLEPYAIEDINEMESVLLPDNINVRVMYDPYGRSASGGWSGSREGNIVYDNSNLTLSSFLPSSTARPEINTGSASQLTYFINSSVAADPADNYMLVVWNHGGGLDGIAWDDTSGSDNLTPTEIKAAISNSNVDHFEIIGFDACLMAMTEQAYDLRSFTDYFVASQELEPGDGWDYRSLLSAFVENPSISTEGLTQASVTTYVDQYAGDTDITMSAISTNRLVSLATELQDFVDAALAIPNTSSDWNVMRSAASYAREFPSGDPGYSGYGYADLIGFLNEVSDNVTNVSLKTEASEAAVAAQNAVFCESGTVTNANGLSIYLPPSGTLISDSWYNGSYFDILNDVRWDNFLLQL